MVEKKLLLLGMFVLLSSVILTSSIQTCDTNKSFLKEKKVFKKCRDLPQLNSHLYWTYDEGTGKLDLAFKHTGISAKDRWVAWAINPNNTLKTSMVGAQALVAISQSGGAPKAYTCSIIDYSTKLQQGNISYPTSALAATRQNDEINIFAILTLPKGTKTSVHLWQDGPLSGSSPQPHELAPSNIKAKEILNLV